MPCCVGSYLCYSSSDGGEDQIVPPYNLKFITSETCLHSIDRTCPGTTVERVCRSGQCPTMPHRKAPKGAEEPALISTNGRLEGSIQNMVRLHGAYYERVKFKHKNLKLMS